MMKISTLYGNKQKKDARMMFNKLYGENIAPAEDRDFYYDICRFKKLYNYTIYNATTFRRDLYETLDGEFKYPRTAVGAALISAAAVIEAKENQKYKNQKDIDAILSPLSGHLSTILKDEIDFYSYLMEIIYPYWIGSQQENEKAFEQKVREQNDTYKMKLDALKKQAEEREQITKNNRKKMIIKNILQIIINM